MASLSELVQTQSLPRWLDIIGVSFVYSLFCVQKRYFFSSCVIAFANSLLLLPAGSMETGAYL